VVVDLRKEVDDIWNLFRSKIIHNKWSSENVGITELVNGYTFSFGKRKAGVFRVKICLSD
jgi:hypothetical protein